jgi:hypothetical protein
VPSNAIADAGMMRSAFSSVRGRQCGCRAIDGGGIVSERNFLPATGVALQMDHAIRDGDDFGSIT